MGKGKSIRRRAKLALAANSGNLHKAQFGKATKWDKLPDAPNPEDFKQPTTRSSRRVLALMELMKDDAGLRSQQKEAPSAAKKSKNKFKRDDQTAQAADDLDGAGEGSKAGPARMPEPSTRAPQPASLDTGPPPSRTKLKRKAKLNERKTLKKLRAQVARAPPLKVEGDGGLSAEHIAFGETASAPPKVNLKRRHWDADNTANERKHRHAEAMAKHLAAAQKKLSAARGPEEGSSTAIQLLQEQRRERTRQDAVEAYREAKRGGKAAVDMQSLKALVRRGTTA